MGGAYGERVCVGAGVVYGDLFGERAEVGPRVALYRVEALGVGMAFEIEPGAVVEADRIDYERVLVPAAGGISVALSGQLLMS